MKLATYQIEYNTSKLNINEQYFWYRDLFYRILIFCLIEHFKLNPSMRVMIEDTSYQGLYSQLTNSNPDLYFSELFEGKFTNEKEHQIVLDVYEEIMVYLKRALKDPYRNVLSMSIRNSSIVEITFKYLETRM